MTKFLSWGFPAIPALLSIFLFSCTSPSQLGFALLANEPREASALGSVVDIVEPEVTDSDREHWAWKPIRRVDLPDVQNRAWPRNAIDYFILSELESLQLSPAGEASKETLLRRLKFDLHGLPPTLEERQRFMDDRSPDAVEHLIDRLLASPAYGERWAQHWLDLARFAETDGFEHDRVRSEAWQFRDWVVSALNGDLPYDQFVRQQLAGVGEAGKLATMFCLAGPDMPDINEQDQRRHDKLNEITGTVGAVFLAMQVQCAQCHDHKYDPISQADFYRLRAVFEPYVPEMQRDKPVHYLSPQANSLPARFYHRGEVHQAGPIVLPGVPRIAVAADASYYCDPSSPREAFADWLVDTRNPLTSRVIVNRLWQHHFGKSLCENPSDFGVVTGDPTHPELLDWLALELQSHGWSLKHLHRLLVASAVYRQAAVDGTDEQWQAKLDIDPANAYSSRFSRRRLDGETIRDALLAVSGQLSHQMYGPGVMPPLPTELLGTLLKGQWETSANPADHVRRSVYLFARRNLRYPIFEVFDRPDAGASCALRDRCTTAIQSLNLLNSELTLSAATALRDQLLAGISDQPITCEQTERLVENLFLCAFCRKPTLAETQSVSSLLNIDKASDPSHNLLTVCIAILNTNEFIYVD